MPLTINLRFLTLLAIIFRCGGAEVYRSCWSCPKVTSWTGTPWQKLIPNHKPHIDLRCEADFPIEWKLHFHEDDNPDFQSIKIVASRDVYDIFKPSTFTYKVDLEIIYSEKIRLFPNFTCQSTKNNSYLTRVLVSGDKNAFRLSSSSLKNDHIFEQNTRTCRSLLYFQLSDRATGFKERGPCFQCYDSKLPLSSQFRRDESAISVYVPCENMMHCRNLYSHVLDNLNCTRAYVLPEFESNSFLLDVENITDQFKYNCRRVGDLTPFVAYCKPLSGPVDVALSGFYGIQDSIQDNQTRGDGWVAPVPYFRWSDVEEEKMIQILSKESETGQFYVGQNIFITCRVSKYYCAFRAQLTLKLDEGGERFIRYTSVVAFPSENLALRNLIEQKTQGFYDQGYKIMLKESGNLTISCYGPVINSSSWIVARRSFNIRDVEPPAVIYIGLNDTEVFSNGSGILHTGDTNRSIICSFIGEPMKSVEWKFNKGSELPTGIQRHVNLMEKFASLDLPPAFQQMSGVYTCVVQTHFSTAASDFVLQVEDLEVPFDPTFWAWVPAVFLLGLLLLILGTLLFHFWQIKKKQKEELKALTELEEDFWNGRQFNENTEDSMNAYLYSMPFDQHFEINPERLQIDYASLLGSGEFGFVYQACILNGAEENEYEDLENIRQPPMQVAVKTSKRDVLIANVKSQLSEIKVMGHVGDHKNVVKFIGACTKSLRERKICIVLELCQNGSLKSFLKKNRQNFADQDEADDIFETPGKLTGRNLIQWAVHIANGLQHIHSKKVIHGDLAARNVLLSDTMVAKISDFGLSRNLAGNPEYIKKTPGHLPWRHLAPESFNSSAFSAKSDVWAFGVTLWEIFTLGETPYEDRTYCDEFIQDITIGSLRLPKPEKANEKLYNMMLEMWNINPECRPPAEDLLTLERE